MYITNNECIITYKEYIITYKECPKKELNKPTTTTNVYKL